jgi:sugar/nucleoside kinase (ribokinase family)
MTLDVVTIGDSVVDIVIPVPRFPSGNEDSVLGERMERQLGGASNFLLQASRLGLKAGIIDCVGDDDLGSFFLETLRTEGVDVSRVHEREGLPTAHCIVLVDAEGNHAYIGFQGATWHLRTEEVDPGYIREARALYVSGYTLAGSPTREAVLRALDIASKAGIPTFFDPSPILSRIPEAALRGAITESETVLLNERELEMITSASDLKAAVHELLELGPETIVLKKGPKGCAIYNRSGTEKAPGFPVKAIDTTGAGDAFNASFLFGRLKGWSLRSSAVLANAVGAIKVMKMGAGTNVPKREEIISFISENNVELPDF